MNQPPAATAERAHSEAVVAIGSRTVYLSGQVALDKWGNLVGEDDLRAQAVQAYANVRDVLMSVGATVSDIVKLTVYVVGYTPDFRSILRDVRLGFLGDGPKPAATLVGVEALSRPGLLIEVDAVAVIE